MMKMNRRQSLSLAAGGFAAGVMSAYGGNPVDQSAASKPTIVMVHGGWHWGGCFQKVATPLAAHGHPVILPDLKAHGYSTATYDQVTDIADQVAPVTAILEAATEPVVLLGHSIGGVVLSYLGEKYPRKIRKLIYLGAFMTPNGKASNDYYASDPAVAEMNQLFSMSADGKGVVIKTDAPALIKAAFYGDCSPRDISIAAANITPIMSRVLYFAPSTITAANFGSIPRVYIETTADHAIPIAQQRKMQADVPGATVMTLDTSHSPFFSAPDRLAEMILAASA